MRFASSEARHGLRSCVSVAAAILAALTFSTGAADARHHHRVYVHYAHHARHARRYAHEDSYSPPSASIIVDGNSGAVLEESNADGLRHPASLTKVMTLYLLFERLDAGKIKLDTPLTISAHAAEQAPTKLGLKPGQTITVEDAIKAVVTRSANDVAVAIAENLGGSEDGFAKLMTQKARELGMSHTTYVNASGLPDDDQVTTARDEALLGRAIQDRFPRYYRFFSTTSFVFRGDTIRGHNHLLGSVPGVDGIKTGFTDASGFNLLTSVHRDGRYIVGAVLGGRTASERDSRMRALIAANIQLAATRRTAPVVADRTEPKAGPQAVAAAKMIAKDFAKETTPPRPDPTLTASVKPGAVVGSSDPIRPLPVKTISYRTVTVRTPSMKPMPVLVPATEPAKPMSVEPSASAQLQSPPASEPPRTVVASVEPPPFANPAPPKAEPAPIDSATIQPAKTESAKAEPAKAETVKVELTKAGPAKTAAASAIPQSAPHAHGGWVIQIGAFDDENEARRHLNDAQIKVQAMLGAADPFTERVQKGDTTLYRARFAGFDRTMAEAACRQLKRSDFACMAVKD
jgi:D-alanyl-D-alanine carboxypeptidase